LQKKLFKNALWEDNVDNLYYGHYSILKQYSGTFFPYKINGELQHGWAPHSGITSLELGSKDKSIKSNRYYVFNSNNKKISINGGYNNVIRIGAPFLYIKDPKQFYSPIIKNSLILFPTHTHEYAGFKDPIQVYKQYLDELKKISHQFSLISVSLGWIEFNDSKIIKIFEDEGISVVSMGPRDNNPSFLINFVKEVSKYDYVSSDRLSSAVFYSLYMEKKVFLYSSLITDSNTWQTNKNDMQNNFNNKLYPQLMWENFDHKSHYYIAEEELGVKFKRSPKELRKIFGWGL
tara:strand:- start:403 stop:1272 length:870 start_codon:yes stop_codon:yes gene_type:complete